MDDMTILRRAYERENDTRDRQLTDDPSQVTCKRCRKMIKVGSDKKGEHGSKAE